MEKTCPHFPVCGGCSELGNDYQIQLHIKKKRLQHLFAPWSIAVPDIIPSPSPHYYRHKVQLPFGSYGKQSKLSLGCYASDSHRVIDQKTCLIQDRDLTAVVQGVRAWALQCKLTAYNEKRGNGFLRHVLLRKGSQTGEILIGLVTNGERPEGTRYLSHSLLRQIQGEISAQSAVVGIVQNVNMRQTNVVLGQKEYVWWGRPFLKERLGQFLFKVGVSTFFQVNPYQTPNLYDEVLRWVPDGASVLDLYSGMGSIALWISRRAQLVTGIEENRASVSAARTAASYNNVKNVSFIAADTSDLLPDLTARGYTVAVVDPPRKGLEEKTIDALLKSSLQRLIYVSCNPESLECNMRALKKEFRMVSLKGFDMFPHTDHIESVAVLER